MTFDPSQAPIVDAMKQRELHLKRKQRATDAMFFRERRFRAVVLTVAGFITAGLIGFIVFRLLKTTLERADWWVPALAFVIVSIAAGVEIGRWLLTTAVGKEILGVRERQLRKRYANELASGRRWNQFYYKGEDISPYVAQVLYFLESDPRFDTVDEALAFVKQHRRESPLLERKAAKLFAEIAAAGTLMVVSSVSAAGVPSSRLMRYVRTEKPGVWYASCSPDAPKVPEFDAGRVALVTVPTSDGGSINSNRIHIARAPFNLDAVAHLFEQQIPGYLLGVTEEDQRREVVYELTLQSAKIDTWLDHDEVEFPGPA